MLTHKTRSVLVTLTGTLMAMACGGGYGTGAGGDGYGTTPPPTTPPPAANAVAATAALAFTPETLHVTAGDVVTFAFGSVPHNVFFATQAGAPADIAGNNADVSITRTFATAGTYGYTCHIHPAMHGAVVVQ